MSEIELARPALSVLLVVAAALLLLRRRFLRFSLRHPWAHRFNDWNFRRPPVWLYLPRLLDWASVLLLVLAMMQPVLPLGQRKTVIQSLDLVLCIDLSASMSQKFEPRPQRAPAALFSQSSAPTRMEAVKKVALEFIDSRPQDRIGLVVFSANAYVVNPLTTDHRVLSEYIAMLDSNTLIGEGLTSVGAGLATSNQLLSFFGSGRKNEGKVVIVLTDAEQNYGMKPDILLEEARQNKTKVYFVGVGVPIENILFDKLALVRATGGEAFNAAEIGGLQAISRQIDQLERNPVEVTEYFRNEDLTPPLLAAAFGLLLAGSALRALSLFYVTG